MPTREPEGAEAALRRVAKSMDVATQKLGLTAGDIKAVGLGAPGPMDLPAGTLVAPPQLPGWWGFNLRDCLSKPLGLPVSFLNDANAAAYGEFWLGSGKDDVSMVLLTLAPVLAVGSSSTHTGQRREQLRQRMRTHHCRPVTDRTDLRLGRWSRSIRSLLFGNVVVMRTRQRLMKALTARLPVCSVAATTN